jgi:hypothetical protein
MKQIIIVDVPNGYKLTQELAILGESGKFDVKTVKYAVFTLPTYDESCQIEYENNPNKVGSDKGISWMEGYIFCYKYFKSLLQ